MDKPQDPHTIWSKKMNIPNGKSFYGDSWEELAFAEDAAGSLWPPRSYTCSFCRREFRSAQALGGHMNVHRRDRAKLKQGDTNNTDLPRQPLENPSDHGGFHIKTTNSRRSVCDFRSKKLQINSKNITDLDHRTTGQRGQTFNSSFPDSSSSSREIICQDSCTFVFSSKPNLEDRCIDFSSPSSASRVSVQERPFFPIPLSQIRATNQEQTKSADADRDYEDGHRESDGSRRSIWTVGTGKPRINLRRGTDLAVSLNLARFEEEQMGVLCKRRRIHEAEELPSSSCKIIHDLGSMEDLDLELRLGANPPKVR